MAGFNVSGFNESDDSKSKENDIKYKDTESMSGYFEKPNVATLTDTRSMEGFQKSDLNDTDSHRERNGNSMSMSNISFVSTRPRKKYPKKSELPETESMMNFSLFSNSGSISPRSLRNNPDNTIANFTISDKISPGLIDHNMYRSQKVPLAGEDSFSINDSHWRGNSSSSSNSAIPEESLVISETSGSDHDSKPSVHSTPEKAHKKKEDDEEQISITAKFNIKIQLSGIIAESIKEVQEVDDSGGSPPSSNHKSRANSSLSQSQEEVGVTENSRNISEPEIDEERSRGSEASNPEEETSGDKDPVTPNTRNPTMHISPEINEGRSCETSPITEQTQADFDDLEYKKNIELLTKLYGDQWKTPGVKEILISQSTKKKKPKPIDDVQHTPLAPPNHNHSVGDFSNCKYFGFVS